MAKGDVSSAVDLMGRFDRRIGQLGVLSGILLPEAVNAVLELQTLRGGYFGECAIRLNLMTEQERRALLDLQQDDVSFFSRACLILKRVPADRIKSWIVRFRAESGGSAGPPNADVAGFAKPGSAARQPIFGQMKDMAALPHSTIRVLAVLDGPRVDMDKVTETLAIDPAVVATLLRVVNSAAFGVRDEIRTVKQAVVTLGLDKLRSLVISVGLLQKYRKVPVSVTANFWQHSLKTAQWCKELGPHFGVADPEELFLCGLLHNIGELVVHQSFQAQQRQVAEQVKSGKSLKAAELDIMGCTRSDIGGYLFRMWKLPASIIQSAMYHDWDPRILSQMPNLRREVHVVNLAWAVCGVDDALDDYACQEALDRIQAEYAALFKLPSALSLKKLNEDVSRNLQRLGGPFSRE